MKASLRRLSEILKWLSFEILVRYFSGSSEGYYNVDDLDSCEHIISEYSKYKLMASLKLFSHFFRMNVKIKEGLLTLFSKIQITQSGMLVTDSGVRIFW